MSDQEALYILKTPLSRPVQSGSSEMKKALRTRKNQEAARMLFARWPNLRRASERLALLLTNYWPDPRKPNEVLLANCLARALKDAQKVMVISNDDVAQQKAFICAVAEELLQCLMLTIMVKNKGSNILWAYDPNIYRNLDDVINSCEEMIWVNKPHTAFNSRHMGIICASWVFSINELKLAGLLDK